MSAPACRMCGDSAERFFSLGMMPLANDFLRPEQLQQPEKRYPLDLAFCPNCYLVQLVETVPPQALFSEYLYFSSYSATMVRHAEELANEWIARKSLTGDHLVMEIGSNDGYLLQFYKNRGVRVLGIEPARNVAEAAIEKGIPTIPEFFGKDFAHSLREKHGPAHHMHIHNVLAHAPNTHDFLEGISSLLHPDGTVVIEVPYLKSLIEQRQFDTIYHEHVYYFSLSTLAKLFEQHGLCIESVRLVPIHGGTLQ